MKFILFSLTLLLVLTGTSVNGDAKSCCDVINVNGTYFPNGNYIKMTNTHYDKPAYKHETEGWCIFYARHWKVDGCDFIRPGGNWSQGMGWSQIDSECPGDIGNNWRYYSWDAEGSDSGPVDPGIGINCAPDAPGQYCPNGWSELEYSNYAYCYKAFEGQLTWYQAQAACAEKGALLASIPDERANDLIVSLTESFDRNDNHQIHIGGSEVTENSWAWVDGVTPWNYTNWDGPTDDGCENCLSMLMKNDAWNVRGKWNDVTCNTHTWSYVCSSVVVSKRYQTVVTTEDGTSGWTSGAINSVWAELASKSEETIEVNCCSETNSVITTSCGNGISCHNICGESTENNSECLALTTSEEADVSKTCLDSNDWCHNSSGLQGKRKKRGAGWWAIPMYKLWYCPGKVQNVFQLRTRPECCLHKVVHCNNEDVSKKCCDLYGLCYRNRKCK